MMISAQMKMMKMMTRMNTLILIPMDPIRCFDLNDFSLGYTKDFLEPFCFRIL